MTTKRLCKAERGIFYLYKRSLNQTFLLIWMITRKIIIDHCHYKIITCLNILLKWMITRMIISEHFHYKKDHSTEHFTDMNDHTNDHLIIDTIKKITRLNILLIWMMTWIIISRSFSLLKKYHSDRASPNIFLIKKITRIIITDHFHYRKITQAEHGLAKHFPYEKDHLGRTFKYINNHSGVAWANILLI